MFILLASTGLVTNDLSFYLWIMWHIIISYFLQNGGRIHGRKLSYHAFMGALMINCYSSEPRFTVPYEIIKNLMDMDTFLTKFRCKYSELRKDSKLWAFLLCIRLLLLNQRIYYDTHRSQYNTVPKLLRIIMRMFPSWTRHDG